MDEARRDAVTQALDVAIAKVARDEIERLCREEPSPEGTASQICRALRELRDLKHGSKPSYDGWGSLFYSLWYQPSQINLAYTLARRLFTDSRTKCDDRLKVFDFGCGTLAMQFGLALAAAEELRVSSTIPDIVIKSEDASTPMKRIGRMIWRAFLEESKGYPELASTHNVCQDITERVEFEDCKNPIGRSWLTVIHVAYNESFESVKRELDKYMKDCQPDLVLVSSRPETAQFAYSPESRGSNHVDCFPPNRLCLSNKIGDFYRITEMRSEVRGKYASLCINDDCVCGYLNRGPSWTLPRFSAGASCYLKADNYTYQRVSLYDE